MEEIIEKIYKEQKLRRLIVDYIETDNKELKTQLYEIIIDLMKDLKII